MPDAIGAQMAFPNRQVIAFCGDGGLSMLMGDLLTIVSQKLPIKIIVFNNSTLGMVRLEQMVGGYPFWGTEMHNPDFSAVAKAIGFHAERVERNGDIASAIERAFRHIWDQHCWISPPIRTPCRHRRRQPTKKREDSHWR